MIPTSLKLSNFTSYGDSVTELDFTKFHLAAISGYNGAGKSSLLDAITWCVWGWSRAGDNADQLIRLGQNQMWVEFTFELDGHLFIVKRSRSKKSGGSTALELWGGSTNSQVHNLTEGTIKATQQKIIDTLHLTFETFTNSSFLRQGHADEFTTKGPTDRKRILADILGLSHYDALEEKAKEKVREKATNLQLLEYQFLEIEAELSQKEEREKILNERQLEERRSESELKEVEEFIKGVENEKQAITSNLQVLLEKKNHLQKIEQELIDLKVQMDLKEQAKLEFQSIILKKADIEKNYALLLQYQEQKKSLEVKRSELIQSKDQWMAVQKVLQQREDKRAQAIQEVNLKIQKYQTESDELIKQNKHLTTHKDICPTCGQPIEEKKNHEIITKNSHQIERYRNQIKDLEAVREKYTSAILPEKTESDSLELKVKELEEETKPWSEINSKTLELNHYSDLYIKLQQAEMGIKTHTEAILDLKKIYQSKEAQIKVSQKELEELSDLEQKLVEIKNGLESRQKIKEELSQKISELKGQVGEAKQLVSRSQHLEKQYEQKRQEKQILQKEKEAFEELALAFGKKGIQAMIIETAIPEIEEETNHLLDRLTEGRMKVRFETQRETKTLRLNPGQAGTEKVPGIIETLDIIISDELGERPYEMYSGGETFRVNFAIRLALSKLLTRRAGAKLQFLVVDEGFGTQDAQGRTRIVEVLDTIKNDFEKIVVITHMDELRDEFPTRIEVSKNSHGSTFEVVGV